MIGRDEGPIAPDEHNQGNQVGYAYLEENCDLFERWRRRHRYFQAWRNPKPQGLAPTAWSMVIESQSTQLSYSRGLRRSIKHKVSIYWNFPSLRNPFNSWWGTAYSCSKPEAICIWENKREVCVFSYCATHTHSQNEIITLQIEEGNPTKHTVENFQVCVFDVFVAHLNFCVGWVNSLDQASAILSVLTLDRYR